MADKWYLKVFGYGRSTPQYATGFQTYQRAYGFARYHSNRNAMLYYTLCDPSGRTRGFFLAGVYYRKGGAR